MSMAAPESEGASPPVNFNQGGEVLRFSKGMAVPRYQGLVPYAPTTRGDLPVRRIKPAPDINVATTRTGSPSFQQLKPKDITSAVTGISAPTTKASAGTKPTMADYSGGQYTPTKTLRELYQERLPLLEEITAAGKDNTAAQIQFFSDLAKAGAAFAQPTAPGQSVVSKLAQSLSESGISENAAKLAASRAATEQALKLKAFEGAEKELSAEEAARRASALQAQQALTRGIEAFKGRKFEVKQGEDAFARQRVLKQEEAALNDLTARLAASRSFMSQAEILARQGEIDGAKIKLSKALEANAKEVDHQRAIDTLNLTQVHKLEAMSEKEDISSRLQTQNNKAAAALQRNRLEQEKILKNKALSQKRGLKEKELAYRKEQDQILNGLKRQEIAIKRQAGDLKSLAAKTKAYKTPGETSSVLLNATIPVDVPDETNPGTTTTEQVEFLPTWASGQISATDTRSKQLATMLDNAVKGTISWDQTGGPDGTGAYVKSTYKFSQRQLKGILKRANLPDSDLSADVKEFARLSLMADDPNAMEREIQAAEDNAKISGMWSSMGKILDPQTASSDDPVVLRKLAKDTAQKAAYDVKEALGLGGLVDRTVSKGFALIGENYAAGDPAERGFFITQRLFVDGLTSAMANMAGKENVKIQERLAQVTPTEVLETTSVKAYIDKSNVYLGNLAMAIEAQENALRGGLGYKQRQQGLVALGKMQRTYHTISDLVNALDPFK